MANIYDLLYQKLVGNITPEEFSDKYDDIKLNDVKDINTNELYGDM